jgi:uncharacterized membrane protein
MGTLQYFYIYLLTVPIFFAIDMVWIGVVARNFYQTQLIHFLGPVNWTAAIVFYLLYIIGIVVFAIVPGLHAGSMQKALVLGALFGFMAYATYDLTNLATLRDWPMIVVVVDIIWGTVLTGAVAAGGYYAAKHFIL